MLKIVNGIYSKAKTEKQCLQFVKAILHRMKFESYKEEFSLEKSILSYETKQMKLNILLNLFPQSILADAFNQYFQTTVGNFMTEVQTVNFKNDDIETWDLKAINYAIISNYKTSLENTDSFKAHKS